jgi:hypothetical protein
VPGWWTVSPIFECIAIWLLLETLFHGYLVVAG